MPRGFCPCGAPEWKDKAYVCRPCRNAKAKARKKGRRILRKTPVRLFEELVGQLGDPKQGLKSITDEQLAMVYLLEVKKDGPTKGARALQAMAGLREKSWRAEWEREAERHDETKKRVRELEGKLRKLERHWEVELSRAKQKMEADVRAATVRRIREEAAMEQRVREGVARLSPGSSESRIEGTNGASVLSTEGGPGLP